MHMEAIKVRAVKCTWRWQRFELLEFSLISHLKQFNVLNCSVRKITDYELELKLETHSLTHCCA